MVNYDKKAKQKNVTTFLDEVKKTIAAEILKPAPKIVLGQEQKVDLSQLKPATYENVPSASESLPGRLFKFNEHFKKAGINFATDIHTMSNALAILTSTNVDEQGIHHSCSCNGPHHALIVAKFSYMVVGEMLTHLEMGSKINKIIEGLGSEAQAFLTKDNHKNYKKIIEMMALLHDTGRPSDGIDQWDDTNELNVIHNIEYLLETANLSEQAIAKILNEVKSGIENKDNLKLLNDDGFLFGAPLGAGDSLHSGHAFHGGLWDDRSYNPSYVRLYKQYPSFQENFRVIVSEVGKFVPAPIKQNGGRLAAVNNYLNWHQCDGDGKSIINCAFANIIYEEFSACDPQQFPIMVKHFGSEKILTEQRTTQPKTTEKLKVDMVPILDVTTSTLSSDHFPKKISDFERNKKEIQRQFIASLTILEVELEKLTQNNTPSKTERKRLHMALLENQKQFFEALTSNSTEKELNTAIANFRKSCKENIEMADKIMGHGWLYRIAEVLIKAVVGLFAGIGMVLGSLVGQGLAKLEHRQKFANTFFTLNQTDESQSLNKLLVFDFLQFSYGHQRV